MMDARPAIDGLVGWNPGDVPPWFDVPPEGDPEPPKPGVPPTWQGLPLRHRWEYHAADGSMLGVVGRYDGLNGRKEVIPFFGAGGKPGAAPEPRPLFGLERLAGNPAGKAVVIVEGEKAAHALQSLGIVALTSPGGSKAAAKADWKPLNGTQKCYVLGDNDEPGQSYVRDVCACLRALESPPALYLVTLPGLPPGGDIVDWLQARLPDWDGFAPLPEAAHEQLFQEFRAAVKEHAAPAPEPSVSGGDEWGEPMSLDTAELPEWPSGVLPEAFGIFAERLSKSTETPPELAALMTLSCLGIAAQGKYRVRVKADYCEPVNIWTATFLPPGSRKTAVAEACLRPLCAWEREQHDRLAPEIAKAEIAVKAIEGKIQALHKRAVKLKGFELNECLEEIGKLESEKPPIPAVPQLWTDDVTAENLGTIMAANGERMGIVSAEGGIFDILAGRYSQGIPNLDVFLKGHAGDAVRVNRGCRPPVFMDNPALSFGLAPQPDVLRALAAKPSFRGRGLLGRFLYAVPHHNLGHRSLDARPVAGDVALNYSGSLMMIANHPMATDSQGRPCAHVLKLDAGAYDAWAAFWYAVEAGMRDGGELENIRDWAGKFPGAIARIAGLLHVALHAFRSPWELPISEETMRAALRLAEPLKAHALAAFNVLGAKPELDDARKVLSWVRRNSLASFSFRDAHQAHRSRFQSADDMAPCIAVLEEREYIRKLDAGPVAHRPSRMYAVNPHVL